MHGEEMEKDGEEWFGREKERTGYETIWKSNDEKGRQVGRSDMQRICTERKGTAAERRGVEQHRQESKRNSIDLTR